MISIILKNGQEIKAYLVERSRSGKNYMVTTKMCDCTIKKAIPTNDILSIDGKDVEPYIQSSVKYNKIKYQVTKVWEHDGHKWFRVTGASSGGRYHYKIIGKNNIEEYRFFKSNRKEIRKGAPAIICRKSDELSIPIDVLREIYMVHMNNKSKIKEK